MALTTRNLEAITANQNIGTESEYTEIGNKDRRKFVLGPDVSLDLRFLRPYFLLTLPEAEEDINSAVFVGIYVAVLAAACLALGLVLGSQILCIASAAGVAVGIGVAAFTFTTGVRDNCADQNTSEMKNILDRIAAVVSKQSAEGAAFTDVIILSHGWHRNFFAAVSAYDRLMSRFIQMRQTQRLPLIEPEKLQTNSQVEEKPGASEEKEAVEMQHFHPLILTLHWHSDPGENAWVDKSGRRHKASFLDNVSSNFVSDPSCPASGDEHAAFLRDFECMFELMSSMSAPGKDAISDTEIARGAPKMTKCLSCYRLRGIPQSTIDEKIAVLWRCYFEAEPTGVFLDQGKRPKRFMNPGEALINLIKFILGLLLLTIISLTLTALWDHVRTLNFAAIVDDLSKRRQMTVPATLAFISLQLMLILATTLAFLRLAGYWKQREDANQRRDNKDDDWDNKTATGFTVWALVPAWLFAQIILVLPLLVYCLISYFFGGWWSPFWNLVWHARKYDDTSDERLGQRNDPSLLSTVRQGQYVRNRLRQFQWKYIFVLLARLPNLLMRKAVTEDSQAMGLLDTVDSQLAFFEMQGKAVESGAFAGGILIRLLENVKPLQQARLHFIGHSFGGLVVANAVRHLVHHKDERNSEHNKEFTCNIASLCLVQGAIASNWFEAEDNILKNVSLISAIYSAYDSANSFYYPLANLSRYSAGYVGLCKGLEKWEQRGGYVSLVRPPRLGVTPWRGQLQKEKTNSPAATGVNIDASRLINGGSLASGGGHSLIFKDEVIHLIWAQARSTWQNGLISKQEQLDAHELRLQREEK